MVTLRLLGGALLENEHGPVSGRTMQRRRLALLALLALSPRKSLSRDKITAYLWPESDAEQARHLLSVAVYELRKGLGENVLVTSRDDVALSEEHVRVDVDEFKSALAAGNAERAAELYCGPLLDGFHINDAPDFEHWVDGERDELARTYAQALENVARARAAQGDHLGAVAAWRRLAAHDPYNARVACGLMLACEAAGDRAGALQHGRTHAQLMREEFGAEPAPEVEALLQRLRAEPREASLQEAPPANSRNPAPAVPLSHTDLPTDSPIERRKLLVPGTAVLLAVAALAYVFFVNGPPPEPSEANVAVVPLSDARADHTNTVFVEGLTDDIINALNKVPDLDVMGRTSALVFRGNPNLQSVARRLGVTHVVELSAQIAGENVRAHAKLINARDGTVMWSQEYDRPHQMANVLSMQEAIARSVVQELEIQLSDDVSQGLVTQTTNDARAREAFITGRYYFHRRSAPDLLEALKYFKQAAGIDPSYALAHAGVAEVYNLLGAFDYGVLPPRQAYPAAQAAVDKALELDPSLSEANAALAGILFNYEWDWRGAEQAYRTSLRANPGNAATYHYYALLLHARGRKDEALETSQRARELDPLAPVIASGLARQYYFARQLPRSIGVFKDVLAVQPQFPTALVGLGMTYMLAGQADSALYYYDAAQRVLSARGQPLPLANGLKANALGRIGRPAEARRELATLEAIAAQRYVPAEYFTIAYIGLGDTDAALAALDRAVENRSAGIAYLLIEPMVDPLRNDPRFHALLQRTGVIPR